MASLSMLSKPVRLNFKSSYSLLMRGIASSSRLHSHTRSLKEFSMANKVAAVTGGARGLGNMFCRAFIEAGCNSIAIIDLHEQEAEAAAKALVHEYETIGAVQRGELTVIGVGCDVASEKSVQSAFGQLQSRIGRVNALVTAAGIVENFPATEYPTPKIQKLFDINVHGSFFCAREVAKGLLGHGENGSIILISSMSANIVNQPQLQTPYNASKAAVKHMASSLAVEWAKSGIRVNALSPGYMMTKLTEKVLEENPKLKESWHTLTPMGRMGIPEELKGAIVFLASDASSYVTGSEIRVDGGYCCV